MPRHELGIVVALPAEAASLGVVRWRAGHCASSAAGRVGMAGIGLERAAAAAEQLLGQGVHMLLSWGVAGALAASLRPGDMLLPQRVLSTQGEWPVDASLRSSLQAVLPVRDGSPCRRLWCSADPVTQIRDKQALAQQDLDAVDMESAAVASVAAQAGVPFAAVKAICDPASRAVPAAASKLLHGDGRLRVRGLLDVALGGPGLWRDLDQLRHDFNAARRALCAASQRLSQVRPA